MKTIFSLISLCLATSVFSTAHAGTAARTDNNPLALASDEVVVKPAVPKPAGSSAVAATSPVAAKPATAALPSSPPVLTVAPSTAPAPAPAPAPAQVTTKSPTYRQLDELRTQNAILAEIVKAKEMQAKLNGQNVTTPGMTGIAGTPNGALSGQSAPDTPTTAQVQMVSGWEGDLIADVVLPTGGKISVRVGQSVPGVGIVKSIKRREVVVANKSQNIILPFANDTTYGVR